jgi:hypothetical protein
MTLSKLNYQKIFLIISIFSLLVVNGSISFVNSARNNTKQSANEQQFQTTNSRTNSSKPFTTSEKDQLTKNALQKFSSGFKENKGQLHNNDIVYYSQLSYNDRFDIGITHNGFLIIKHSNSETKMYNFHFIGSRSHVLQAFQEFPTKNHYFLGRNNQCSNIRSYQVLQFSNLWGEINLILQNDGGQFSYQLEDNSHATSNEITIHFQEETIFHQGNKNNEVSSLSYNIPCSVSSLSSVLEMIFSSIFPETIFDQIISNSPSEKQPVNFSHSVYSSDTNLEPLISSQQSERGSSMRVSSEIQYSTFIGGDYIDHAYEIVRDPNSGAVYVCGVSVSPNFPSTSGAFMENISGSFTDGVIFKLSADGSKLEFSTFIGGQAVDKIYGLDIDASGNLYLSGVTYSVNFPTTPGAYNETHSGGGDAFLCKLSNDGSSLEYSTLIGGKATESSNHLAINPSSSEEGVYIIGTTGSEDFPTTTGAFSETLSGIGDFFVSKFSNDCSTLLKSTLIGGMSLEQANDFKIDPHSKDIYLTGWAESNDFPTTTNAIHQNINPNSFDCFVMKLSTDFSSLVFSTLIGGEKEDTGYSIDFNPVTGECYVGGYTNSNDFPTTSGCFDQSFGGNGDGFLCKLSGDGSTILKSTFIGGSSQDKIYQLAIDSISERIFLTGETNSDDFPTTNNALSTEFQGKKDCFLAVLSLDYSALEYSTFLGGVEDDWGCDLIINHTEGTLYLLGNTASTDFPTTLGTFDENHNGESDIFVCKIIIPSITPAATGFRAINFIAPIFMIIFIIRLDFKRRKKGG